YVKNRTLFRKNAIPFFGGAKRNFIHAVGVRMFHVRRRDGFNDRRVDSGVVVASQAIRHSSFSSRKYRRLRPTFSMSHSRIRAAAKSHKSRAPEHQDARATFQGTAKALWAPNRSATTGLCLWSKATRTRRHRSRHSNVEAAATNRPFA